MSRHGTINRHRHSRRGYALVMVVLFNVLFLMLLGIAWRQTASVIRVATARSEQIKHEEGAIGALGRAMYMLEKGRPPIGSDTVGAEYSCYMNFGTESYFKIKFKLTATSPETWSVSVTAQSTQPTDSGPLVVDAFPT